MKKPSVTERAYREFDIAYEKLNAEFFDNALPGALITFQREQGSQGYFSPNRFIETESKAAVDEIALNPRYFSELDVFEVISILAHQMVHQWIYRVNQNYSRSTYHSRAWAQKCSKSA